MMSTLHIHELVIPSFIALIQAISLYMCSKLTLLLHFCSSSYTRNISINVGYNISHPVTSIIHTLQCTYHIRARKPEITLLQGYTQKPKYLS